jgi:hypothetical protein
MSDCVNDKLGFTMLFLKTHGLRFEDVHDHISYYGCLKTTPTTPN